MKHLYAFLVCLGMLAGPGASQAEAQLAAIRGRVVDASDAQPLPGVNVVLVDEARTRTGTATNAEGFFVLANLPPGRYVLTVSFVGYTPLVDTLALAFGDKSSLSLQLVSDETELEEVVVESEAGGAPAPTAGLARIRPGALARVPMPDVSGDLMGYLLTMPGVVTAGDRGGQVFVRGGTPTQNLVLIDGMLVYQPFHIVGFYSVFPADIVSYADVYAGGFGARYGGRISSVIDVATRNGNKKAVAAAVSVAPFLSAARVELPFVPDKVSILASVRESVIERIAPDVLGQALPYRFGDRFFKVHAFLNRTSNLSFTALRSYDEGRVAGSGARDQRVAWRNAAYGGRYLYLPSDFPVLAELQFYTSRYESEYGPAEAPERTSEAVGFHAGIDFAYLLGAYELRFGIFGRSTKYQYNFGARNDEFKEFLAEGGGFIQGRLTLSPTLRLEPGLRLHSFPSRSQVSVEPRLLAVWQPEGAQGRQQFNAAWGLYRQQIVGLNVQRDVTDTFTAWAPSPPGASVPTAMHFITGWQRRLLPWLELGIEGYLKRLHHIAVPRFQSELTRRADLYEARGSARGIDVQLEVARAYFYGFIGYGLAAVTYQADGRRFPPPHDRRHQLNVMGRFARGPYAFSLRWQVGSGLPFTQLDGFFETLRGLRTDAFRTDPGITSVAFHETYQGRLPSYHRLDLSVERTFNLRFAKAVLHAGLINVYDRNNIFDYDLLTGQRVDQLPLIPSLGLKVGTR